MKTKRLPLPSAIDPTEARLISVFRKFPFATVRSACGKAEIDWTRRLDGFFDKEVTLGGAEVGGAMMSVVNASPFWKGEAKISESTQVVILLQIYDSTNSTDQDFPANLKSPEHLCYAMEIWSGIGQSNGFSACQVHIKNGTPYIDSSSLDHVAGVLSLALPLPNSSAPFYYVTQKDSQWKESNALSWTQITLEEAGALQKHYDDDKETYIEPAE
jgi:hypothetical protein